MTQKEKREFGLLFQSYITNIVLFLFAIFIFACGTTHIMNVWTTWSGAYRIEGLVKAFTAIVSIVTTIVLWYYLPTVLRLPAPRELETTNRKLQTLAAESQKKASELAIANQELERFNEAMVGREERIVELKKEINQLTQELGRPEPYKVY